MSVARGFPNAGHFYSNIVKPVKIDCTFTVTPTNGLGVTSLKSNGYVRNVFMHTSTTPASNDGYLNPNPAAGYAFIQLKQNFNHYLGESMSIQSPTTGGTAVINGSALTIGNAYIIAAVGAVPAPHFQVSTVADTAGSLAGKYFTIADVFGNNYVIWFSVSGTGSAPSLTGALLNYIAVQQSITTGDSANTIATALRITIAAINGTASFSTSGATNAVIITSAAANHNLQFSNLPSAGTSGVTVSVITWTSLQADWNHVGVPPGITPAVGLSFIAIATGGAVGSGTVIAAGVSGIVSVEVVGSPDVSINNQAIASNGGAWLLVQFLGATASGDTTLIPTAPATASVVSLSMYFDASSVTVDGL